MAEIVVGHHYSVVDPNGRLLNYEVLSVDKETGIVKVRDGSSVEKEVPIRVFMSMDDSFVNMEGGPEGEAEPKPAE